MSKTMLGDIELPPDLHWSDEHHWLPVGAAKKTSLTGALILQIGRVQADRPITLEGSDSFGWVTYKTVEALKAAASDAETYRVLALPDGRSFTVRFRVEEYAIEADPVSHRVSPDPDLRDKFFYIPTIRLATVTSA